MGDIKDMIENKYNTINIIYNFTTFLGEKIN